MNKLIIFLLAILLNGCSQRTTTLSEIDPAVRIGQPIKAKYYATNSAIEEYISRIGKRVLIVSDDPYLNYQFKLGTTNDPELFIDPNGIITLNHSLLKKLKNEAELAAILSYSIVQLSSKNEPNMDESRLIEQDRLGMVTMSRAGYDPQAIIDLQEKTAPWIKNVFQNPPTITRINSNKVLLKTLPQGLQTGTKSFQQGIGILPLS
jgi:predicted Zn-dependent protease